MALLLRVYSVFKTYMYLSVTSYANCIVLLHDDLINVAYLTACDFLFDMFLAPLPMVYILTVKAATLIFISGRSSAISSVTCKQGKSGCMYNLVKNR